MKVLVLIGVALTLLSCSVVHQDQRWTGRMTTGQVLEIRGFKGTIRALPSETDQFEVTAHTSGRRNDRVVKIESGPTPRGWSVTAGVFGVATSEVAASRGDAPLQRVTVDFTVKAPTGIGLLLKTIDGNITARGLTDAIDANTVNGDVEIESSAAVRASSVRGSIRANISAVAKDHTFEFKSVHGNIDLTLPSTAGAEFRASTINGSVQTDFPMTLTGRLSPRALTGRLGPGGPELTLSTVSGEIVVRRADHL